MKRVMVVATTLLLSVCTNAQNAVGSWGLQPRVGINLATMTNDNDAKTRIGLVAGAELEYQASPLLSVSAGALYSQQGADADISSLDFAIPLGISYEFSHVVLNARYNLSLTGAISAYGESTKHSVFQITLGYKFGL